MNVAMVKNNRLRGVYTANTLSALSVVSSFTRLHIVVIAWMSFCLFSGAVVAKERYQPKNISVQSDQFLARVDQPVINVEYIIAHTVNTAFHALRQGRESVDDVVEGSNAGSVVIGAGTDVGDLIIINDNDGDNIVINKR